jgi:hypothetical protein
MHQIRRGTTETAEVEIYSNNQLVNADGDVTVTVFDADYGTQVGSSGVAFNDPALGKYTFDLDSTYTYLNRVLQVVWSYTLNGKTTSQEDFYEAYTPYASVSDIIDYYGFGTRASDLNYRSQDEIQSAEFIARMQVENYTGQTFGRKWGDQEIFGNNSDALELIERMISIEKLYENGILSIDYTTDPISNNFGWDVELTTTNRAIRIVNNSNQGAIAYDSSFDPTVLYAGRFRSGYRYKIWGEKGWIYVPQDVRRCTVMLAGDYLSKDAEWRNKYLKKIQLGEIDFELDSGAFTGTGNVIVDQILDQYRNTGIVII